MPLFIQAALWGLLSGSALLIGAAVGYFANLPQRLIAGVMAIGAGVLISAVAFELMDEAYRQGGFGPAASGLIAGAVVFTAANFAINHKGGRHRKRSGSHPVERQAHVDDGGGLALAAGALIDGIPESVVIGVSLLEGGTVSVVTVAAVFLSNVPEGLSSSAGMKRAGRSVRYVLGLWAGIALMSGIAAMVGNLALANSPPEIIAAVTAIAAGGILAMLVDTMIPEATEKSHEFSGLIAVLGFLVAYALSKAG